MENPRGKEGKLVKVLFATDLLKVNPIVRQLISSVSAHKEVSDVYYGVDSFWSDPFDVDIVHLQWPHVLFKWNEPTERQLNQLKDQIAAWHARAPIVITVHDRYPHYRDTDIFRRLFDMVYQCVDGVIHMGQTSKSELEARYPQLAPRPKAFIPIGTVDTYFVNEVTQNDARRILGIPPSVYACLSFGYLRDLEETNFLLNGFKALKMPDKYLLIAGNSLKLTNHRWRLVRILQRLRLTHYPKIRINNRLIPDNEVQYYCNAANVVVIPRLQVLNSSNVSLGFSFGKVVVGPDDGTVGEILRETRNPTFIPGDVGSLADALIQARTLDLEGKGQENKAYAVKHWNWEHIAQQHVDFYKCVVSTIRRT
jgi:glycosyltransferase involved in cell wall biosynthesis